MGDPGGLPSMGSHRVGHDWSDLAATQQTSLEPILASELTRKKENQQQKQTTSVYLWVCSLYTHVCQVASVMSISDSLDYTPPGSSVSGILQARILEWVAVSFPRASSQPGDGTRISSSPALAGGFFTTEPPGKPLEIHTHTHTHTHTYVLGGEQVIFWVRGYLLRLSILIV